MYQNKQRHRSSTEFILLTTSHAWWHTFKTPWHAVLVHTLGLTNVFTFTAPTQHWETFTHMDSLADECCQWPCCTCHKVSAYSRSCEDKTQNECQHFLIINVWNIPHKSATSVQGQSIKKKTCVNYKFIIYWHSMMSFFWLYASPFGVIVNEHVVFHRQFEVWDLLTHPPVKSTHIKLWLDHTPDTVTYCGSAHKWSQRAGRSFTEWSR